MSFVDAYSGFHQIPLYEPDQIKTSFITPYGAYCYLTMPFGLRNAGATYQRCMQKCLHDQIDKNVQVYVDDVVIKTKESEGEERKKQNEHFPWFCLEAQKPVCPKRENGNYGDDQNTASNRRPGFPTVELVKDGRGVIEHILSILVLAPEF